MREAQEQIKMRGAQQGLKLSFQRYKDQLARGYDLVNGQEIVNEEKILPYGKVTVNSDTWAKTLATSNDKAMS